MDDPNNKEKLYLVTGPVQGGKSTYLKKLCKLLKERELKVGGFLCPGSFEAGKRVGFKLRDIATGSELHMATVRETPGWTPYKRFWFNPEAFRQGGEWVASALKEDCDVLIIDEVGPMELEGSGWADLLESVGNSEVPVQLWNVRKKLTREVMKRWQVAPACIISIEELSVEMAADWICEAVRVYRKLKEIR